MAAINDLVAQIQDEDLRQRIEAELKRVMKHKKFGLVFEDHLPEGLNDGPIYPGLEVVDSVRHAQNDQLWHALIEADNYYALQLLAYLYPGQVDCIYIDPPYNTGARDWKYNNDYVDSADTYRHSKWLSMMKRRLLLAKRLLNPKDSVLIVTIDEKEYLHLGCLLEELFPEARMQMISSVIKPEGTQRRNEFSRTNEYIFFLMFGEKVVLPYKSDMASDASAVKNDVASLTYKNFRRTDSNSIRTARPNQFYPIFVDVASGKIVGVGDVMPSSLKKEDVIVPGGQMAIFPLRDNGQEMLWRRTPDAFRETLRKGYAYAESTSDGFIIKYLSSELIKLIESGDIIIKRRESNGKLIGEYASQKLTMPKTVWNLSSHSARDYGSLIIKRIFGDEIRFTFPKSLYAVVDSIALMVANNPNALIVDFFAGSGTTLHAVNLLNAEDGGHRRCIMVTNNEVSVEEAKSLTAQGFKPGDAEWERLGIAQYVNWPRTVCSIKGTDVNGQPLKGEYLGTDHRQMADGFETNAIFFRLNFLDKNNVALGKQFRELLPLLWMKSGAIGTCPILDGEAVPDMLVLPNNEFAVLNNEKAFGEFFQQIMENESIRMVYLIVDSDAMYREMAKALTTGLFASRHIKTCQLYRDYLDNFRINIPR